MLNKPKIWTYVKIHLSEALLFQMFKTGFGALQKEAARILGGKINFRKFAIIAITF